MKNLLSSLKYSLILVIIFSGWISFQVTGWLTFLPLLLAFGAIPLAELFIIRPDIQNLSADYENRSLHNPLFDWLLWITVPFQVYLMVLFLNSLMVPGLDWITFFGRVLSMGLFCGIIGINVAHELGHRVSVHERMMARLLLLSSLYMHFIIEHNRGHHKRVATLADPASARKGENLYAFWFRSIVFSWISAWHLEENRLTKLNRPVFSHRNEMLWGIGVQAGLIWFVFSFFGWMGVAGFVLAAVTGILLLETVNYIEHYGLVRREENGHPERVKPEHSWNSDHILGRLLLFELSRHSDHHYLASRKYQILRHFDHSPQMPTGYPGMLWLALFPPLWFRVMDKRIPN